MKKKWIRNVLVAALICLVAGGLLLAAGLRMGGQVGVWIDRDGIHSNREYRQMKEKKETAFLEKTRLDGQVDTIDMKAANNKVILLPSEDDNWYLEYKAVIRQREPEYGISDGRFKFRVNEGDTGSGTIGFLTIESSYESQSGYIKLYIPESAQLKEAAVIASDGSLECNGLKAQTISLNSSYGSITTDGGSATQLNISASDGKVSATGGSFDHMEIASDYGSVLLDRVSSETLKIKTSDGNTTIDNSSAGEISVDGSYGSIRGTAIKADKMILNNSDGSIEFSGLDVTEAQIDNSYGSVKLHLAGAEDEFSFDLGTSDGSLYFNGVKISGEDDSSYISDRGGTRMVKVRASDGRIEVETGK